MELLWKDLLPRRRPQHERANDCDFDDRALCRQFGIFAGRQDRKDLGRGRIEKCHDPHAGRREAGHRHLPAGRKRATRRREVPGGHAEDSLRQGRKFLQGGGRVLCPQRLCLGDPGLPRPFPVRGGVLSLRRRPRGRLRHGGMDGEAPVQQRQGRHLRSLLHGLGPGSNSIWPL